MDLVREPFWGTLGDVKGALRNMLQICGKISTQLEELIIFVSEEALHNEDDYFELARCLPRTFRTQASLGQLRGVAVFFEVQDEMAVKEFRRGLGTDTEFFLRVLQREPNDVTRSYRTGMVSGRPTRTVRTTPVVVTEGESFRCGCDRKEITQRRYVDQFLGESLLSHGVVCHD